MTNKNRLSKRKPKLPNKFNDHIMDNLCQKRNVSDELEAFRVSNNDKVDELGKLGESSKEKVKEGIDCVNDGIYKSADVSGGMEKHNDQECGDMDMRMNKGVFGTGDNDKEQEVCDENAEMDSASRGSEEVKTGNPEPSIELTINVNDKPNCDELNKEKSYASKLASGLYDNNELFFIPTGMKENGGKEVVFDEELVKEDGMCYFKFKKEEGMNYVIDQSPWLVNGKPLLVQKWDPDTIIIKEAPCKIPIWIRLFNIPLEAWSVRGISALASRLGRPIKMDQVTGEMCKAGVGRLGYARVLIEINVEDEFVDKIEINYVDEMRKVKSTKWRCDVKPKPKPAVNNSIRTNDGNLNGNANQEGFVEVRNRKNFNTNKKMWNNANQGNKKQQTGVNVEFRPKAPPKKGNVDELRKSANKYAVLSKEEDHIEEDPFIDKRLKVDGFIKKKIQPTCEETKNWNYDMITYFKYQWEAMERKDKEDSEEEDVYEIDDQATKSFIADEVMGIGCELKQKEVRKFTAEEKVKICAILETHLKSKSIGKACEYVFGKWRWVSNVVHSPTSCRIVVGWNADEVDVMVVQSCQTILCLVEVIQTKIKLFVSFVYASNSCIDRRELWNELSMHKSIVDNKAWALMGDFNVTLKPEEHSNGASRMSIDMNEFKDVVNMMEDDFLDLVKEEWKHEMKGCHMYKVVQRLKHLKKPLNKLNWQNGNLFVKANNLKEKLKEAQSKMDADPSNLAKRQNAVELVNEYTTVAEDELKLLHQKARIQWLKEGDKNSAYFHNIIKAGKNKSRIESICCEDGSRVEGNLVNGQFVEHFQKFFRTTLPVSSMSSMGDIVKLKLSEAEALDMIKEISDKEIKEALFDIDSSKAAGPDGYTSCFFKKAWGIIGNDICLAIKEFFITGRILGEINATLIALVPKIDTPNKVSDFRPIACCNVLYKCISKIPTNRIKEGLSKVVSLNQSAFIPGRHIQDNILITLELLKGYNRRSGAKICAMKIDIQKAYDTVSWEFLKKVMLMVGFHGKMVHWIMTCITSASFSICINGEINGFFKDDLMVLCNGDTESLKVVKSSLDEFSTMSGLFLNLSKSTIFFRSISEALKEDMLNILPFKCGKLPMKYLGVPLLAKRLWVKDCQSLIDNVENRINCWRNKFLSYAGRIQLIAYVLSTMQQYWASVYMLPIYVVNGLEKLFKRILWNPGGSIKGRAKISWKKLRRPKEQGGLGFKPLHKWNEVLLISQLWKLIDKKESLWVKWVSTVKLKGKSIWEVGIDNSDGHGWKELMRIRDKIKPYVKFKIGNGRSISVWHDKWCDLGPLDRFIHNRDIYDVRMSNEDCLADAILDGRWKWADEWGNRFPEICQIDMPILTQKNDKAVWMYDGNKSVEYSTNKAWVTLRDVWPKVKWHHGCLGLGKVFGLSEVYGVLCSSGKPITSLAQRRLEGLLRKAGKRKTFSGPPEPGGACGRGVPRRNKGMKGRFALYPASHYNG
uniref:Reverse transcriptase domain-containing protein n=1 Tax=Tanacetum cinerariifolium TaxID=118510 RepID=A0A6L2KLV8_TANCI|nr:hypothetical protein [Tanacetum cinerariifolium]